MITYNSHPLIKCSINRLGTIWRGTRIRLKSNLKGQGGRNALDATGQEEVWDLENWTIFKKVMCVSLLTRIFDKLRS